MTEIAGQRQDDDRATMPRLSNAPVMVAIGFVALALVSMALAICLSIVR